MAEVSDQSKYVAENLSSVDKTKETNTTKKQGKGIFSRMWNVLFGSHKDDFEKRLQNISKEEATVRARMKRRTQNWRRMARNLIVFSVLLEAVAVAYAIMTTRTMDLEWKTRAVRVLPMFLLPGLTAIIYTTLGSFSRMCERKDKKTLERLREERQTKIDELKERTNYYITQQLIQRYDPDPAAKAAAASVLASKLGAESGFKVVLGDDSKVDPASGKSRDVEVAQSKGLRNRHNRSNSTGTLVLNQSAEEVSDNVGPTGSEPATHYQVVVDHHPNSTVQDGGWIAHIAALLVGEDPTQSYALICGNCRMHNGLARKEDFAYITYYCPHCHALNKSKQLEESGASVANSSNASIPDTPNSGEVTIAPTTSNQINKNLSAFVETLAGEIGEKVAEEPDSS